jgi:hypothetical protein
MFLNACIHDNQECYLNLTMISSPLQGKSLEEMEELFSRPLWKLGRG